MPSLRMQGALLEVVGKMATDLAPTSPRSTRPSPSLPGRRGDGLRSPSLPAELEHASLTHNSRDRELLLARAAACTAPRPSR